MTSLFFEKLGIYILKVRFPLLAFVLLLTSLAAYQIATGLKFDYSPSSVFLTDDPNRIFHDKFKEVFGQDDNLILLAFTRPKGEIFTPGFLRQLAKMTFGIDEIKQINRVVSIVNAPYIEFGEQYFAVRDFIEQIPESKTSARTLLEEATANPLYHHQLISTDGRTLAMMVEFDENVVQVEQRKPVLDEIREIVRKGVVAAEKDELELGSIEWHLAGIPVVQVEYVRILNEDMLTLILIAFITLALLLLIVFRNLHGIYIPLGAVAIACCCTIGLIVVLGEKINFLSNTIPTLIIIIGVADSIHILARYYEEIGIDPDKRAALIKTVEHIGLACLLTSVTTAVGFASLYTAKITIIKSFGLFSGIGVMIAFAVNIIWMPTILSIQPAPQRGVKTKLDHGAIGLLMTTCGKATIERKRAIALISLGCFSFGLFGLFQVGIEGRMTEEVPHSNPVWQANNFIETHLTGLMPKDFAISGPPGSMKNPEVLRAVEQLQRSIEQNQEYITRSTSLVDMLKEMNQAFHDGEEDYYKTPESREIVAQYLLLYEMDSSYSELEHFINTDYSKMRVSVMTKDSGFESYFKFRDSINQKIEEIFPEGIEVRLTGSSTVFTESMANIILDLISSVVTAFIFVFIVMLLIFRSFRLATISMIPTLLPILFTLGFMGVTGIKLRPSTTLISSISLGIAVDNTIHFIARFRKEIVKDWDYPAAIMRTMISTGRAIVFTSIILVLGFMVLAASELIALKHLAMLGGLTMLTALFSSLFLLPVCLLTFKPVKKRT